MTLQATYLLPLAVPPGEHDLGDLESYLTTMSSLVDQVVVVDGSGPAERRSHASALEPAVEVVPPRPELRTPMGKVGGVLTGLEHARHEKVVVADDDVRYDEESLIEVLDLLDAADVVRPANYFAPLPWHARWDTARILLNRASSGDWPGTLAVRRSAVLRCGGYSGEVMFENLELVRTLRAAGGTETSAPGVLVHRLPPTATHFRSQRVRQAYDELARPARMLAGLAVLPVGGAALARHRFDALIGSAGLLVAVAEVGRRRSGGARVFPATSSLLAPLWVLERGVCSWLALAVWLRGGVRYRAGRLRRAATAKFELRRRFTAAAGTSTTASRRCSPQVAARSGR